MSASSAVVLTANTTATTTTLTVAPNPVAASQMVTLTAPIAGVNPTGTVTFRDGGVSLGIYAVIDGAAELTTNFSTAGAHSLTASYSGDANNQASSSVAVVLNVGAAPGTPGSMAWGYAYDAQGNVKSVTDRKSVV